MRSNLFTPAVLQKLKTREAQIKAGKQVKLENAKDLRKEMLKIKGKVA
ncbi:MAG TPA: hypothetical protein VJP02_05635 [Candidatus Sulfotelmatobacter sp.]|nr:hypothetical protein [Candidatus Sulfotelmatobacter sp.]